MPEKYPTLLHEWFEELWNQGREETIDRLMGPEAIAHGIVDSAGNEARGPEPFKSFFRGFHGAFPDLRIHIEEALVFGDKTLVRCVVEGTHSGHTLGFAATGKPVKFTGMCLARIRDGRIEEAWNNFDFLSFYQQLGVAPPGLSERG
jgi:steroid delta-isomerase-like uncharacterized protein